MISTNDPEKEKPLQPDYPDIPGAEFARTADGLLVARVGDLLFALVNNPDGSRFLASARQGMTPISALGRRDFYGHDGRVEDEQAFFDRVAVLAEHQQELAVLKRRSTRMSVATPWGASQTAVIYGEGVMFHETASHGGFFLNRYQNAKVAPDLCSEGGWYEEDAGWAIVAITFPQLFTRYERSLADTTLRDTWPDAWERIHGRVLGVGQSYARDRATFDLAHAEDWVVVSALQSDHHPGMVEAIATLGGRHGDSFLQRRFLVPNHEYARRDRFGFVIDLKRHTTYVGPSAFVTWRE